MAENAVAEWDAIPATPASKKAVPKIPLTTEQLEKVKAHAAETDRLLGLRPGTSMAQLWEESNLNPNAVSPAKAEGLAQIMPKTREGYERIHKRKFDAFNIDDALFLHRETMKGFQRSFKTPEDTLRGYNGGMDRNNWNNNENRNYVPKINARIGRVPGVDIPGEPATPLLQRASSTQPAQPSTAEWDSLPATAEWDSLPTTPQTAQAKPGGYKPFAPVRKDIDEASLNKDPDFIRASKLMYELFERKKFEKTDSAAADYGKNGISAFNFNLADLAIIGKTVTSEGSQEQKEAFLYMLDTYENTNVSWAGFGRAAWHSVTDPFNVIGVGTLGVGLVGKFAARKAAVEAARETVKQSIKSQVTKRIGESVARTGMVAGIDTAVAMAATDATKQGVAVSAGRQKEVNSLQVAKEGGKGFVFGLVGGTALDATVAKIYRTIRGKPEVSIPGAKATPDPKADFTVDPQGNATSTKAAPQNMSDEGNWLKSLQDANGSTKVITDNSGREITLSYSTEFMSLYEQTIVARGANGEWLGTAKLEAGPKNRRIKIEVERDNRKLGIGTALFDFAEEIYGVKLPDKGWPVKRAGDAPAAGKAATPNEAPSGKTLTEADKEDLVKRGFPAEEVYGPAAKAADEAPLGSTLTPEELAAATARKQQGRLPEDNVVPPMTGNEPRLKAPFVQTGLRDSPMSLAEQSIKAQPIVEQIRQITVEDLPGAMEMVRRSVWDSSPGSNIMEEFKLISRALQDHADELSIREAELLKLMNGDPNALGYATWTKELEGIQARKAAFLANDATGTFSGQLLRQRGEGLGDARGITVESIMEEKGIPRAEAEQVWADTVAQAQQSAEIRKMEATYEAKAQEALDAGDLTQAARIAVQKRIEAAAMGDQLTPGGAGLSNKLVEASISNVFSPTTVQINVVPSLAKTLSIPFMKFLAANPAEKASRAELFAAYSAMRSGFWGAVEGARAAYKYEQALLTGDLGRFSESSLALTGRTGGLVRFFPRVLNASDELLARLNYDSFVAGKAAAEAAMTGEQQGLKGKALNAFIKDAVDVAIADSRGVENSSELVQPIINKGLNLGLTGNKLFDYVETEAVKNPAALMKGTDQEALDFVRDVLFKRQFSGTGNASKLAQTYENVMNQFPSFKLVLGQLFFRTPIRVFEEGIRLTPGLQLIAPNFISDLAGRNGALRQVRAQSEAMTSLAIAGAVLSLYGQGRLTGDMAYKDWKQQRNRTDGPMPPPYTLKMSDGSTWSYRGFDPIATPVKIMINGLERLEQLRMREAQGEFINKSELKHAAAYLSVGTTAIAAAIRDANLVAGINTSIDLFENLADPERKEDAWLKYMGEKLSLLVPNTFHKIAKDNDPTIKDPATFLQVVDQKLAAPFWQSGQAIKTAYSYDVLGNVRKPSDEDSLWFVFAKATPEERAKGLSPEALIVLTELDRLSKETDTTFKPPTKHPELGELDLRTVLASDGKRTLYDVWQNNYRSLKPEIPLAIIAQTPIPVGTKKEKAAKVEQMQQLINQYQQDAFDITKAQEAAVLKRLIEEKLYKANAESGKFDLSRPK